MTIYTVEGLLQAIDDAKKLAANPIDPHSPAYWTGFLMAIRRIESRARELSAAQPSASDPVGAAYAFVETMVPRADAHHGPAPLWYGWALREAYLAGAATRGHNEP